MEKERVYLWDNLKFFTIICILILHSTIPYAKDGMALMYYGQTFINLYPMTLFAIISGFWFKERSIKNLAILFLWPCVLFTIINGILGITSPHFTDYLGKFMFKAGYAMWYLLALFLFSVVTAHLVKRFNTTTALIIAVVFSVAVGVVPIPNQYFDIQRISSLFPSFVFGVWLRDAICKKSTTLPAIDGKMQWGG